MIFFAVSLRNSTPNGLPGRWSIRRAGLSSMSAEAISGWDQGRPVPDHRQAIYHHAGHDGDYGPSWSAADRWARDRDRDIDPVAQLVPH